MTDSPFVRPDTKAFLHFLDEQPGPKLEELPPEGAREMMRAMGQVAEMPRGELAEVREIEIPSGHGHNIPARLYRAEKSSTGAPVLVYYHGGGWVIGDLETHDPLCAEIARALGMTVISVDYRLAPEHPFPAAGEDCIAATEWTAGAADEIGHRVTGLVLAGDSAGGNLAAVCSQELNGKLDVPILAQWLIYPGVDMSAEDGSVREFSEGYLLTADSMAWFMNHYLGTADRDDPRASPIKAGDLSGQPRTLVFTCGLDPLRDQGRAYAARLIASGVRTLFREAKGQIHGCMNLRQAIPSAQGDLAGCIGDLRLLVNEAEAEQSMRQAA